MHGPIVTESLQEAYGIAREQRLGTTTWSPLHSGLLTGKYNDGIPDDARDRGDAEA